MSAPSSGHCLGRWFVLLAMFSCLTVGCTDSEVKGEDAWFAHDSTFSPGPHGAKALYLLLGQLGLEVGRLRGISPYEKLPPNAVLWILRDAPFLRREERTVRAFIENGGALVAPPSAIQPLVGKGGARPASVSTKTARSRWGDELTYDDELAVLEDVSFDEVFAEGKTHADEKMRPLVGAVRVGKGRAIALDMAALVRNGQIGQGGNGPFVARLAMSLGHRHFFDEEKVGFGQGGVWALLLAAPYRLGVLQLGLACLLGVIAAAWRKRPAEREPAHTRRRTADHIAAVSSLWTQARDLGLPLVTLMEAADARARLRLGNWPRPEDDATPFLTWIDRVRPDLSAAGSALWARCQRLCAARGGGLPEREVVAAARDLQQLEREANKW